MVKRYVYSHVSAYWKEVDVPEEVLDQFFPEWDFHDDDKALPAKPASLYVRRQIELHDFFDEEATFPKVFKDNLVAFDQVNPFATYTKNR